MDRNELILEVLHCMEKQIEYGIRATSPQDREDLKQDITTRLVKVANEMELVSFWQFMEQFDEKK